MTAGESDKAASGFQLTLETIEPGWLLLPEGLTSPRRESWIADATRALRAAWGELWRPEHENVVPALLEQGLADRDASPSPAVFQVWPIFAPLVALCRVTALPSEAAPPWSDLGGVLHRIETAGLGPGVQWTLRGGKTLEDGSSTETVAVHYAFDDGDMTIIVGVDETLAALFVRMLPGLHGMLETIRIERADGTPFRGAEPTGVLEDVPWQIEVPR